MVVVGLRTELKAVREENEQLRSDNGKTRTQLRQCATRYRENQAEIADLRRQVDALQATVAATTGFASKLMEQVGSLTKDLTRSPEVLSEAILTGIGTILNGHAQAVSEERAAAIEQTSMGALGLGNDGGVPSGHFFPDVEFDEFMEGPHQWPTPGMMTTHSPIIPTEGQHPVHAMTENGPQRMDGQPMFQAGTSGSPPVGGVES